MSHYITNSGTPPLYPLPSPLAQAWGQHKVKGQ
jgi:hypothetical protein